MLVDNAVSVPMGTASVGIPPIYFQLENLEGGLNVLASFVNDLVNKLDPILGPEVPSDVGASGSSGPGQGVSDLANKLSNQVYAVQGLNDRVRSLLERVEI